MSSFKLDDAFEAALIADLEPRIERAGDVFSEQLATNVSYGPRSGIHWPGLPHQSSTVSEFPQEQFGDLKDSADNRATSDPLERHVGFFDQPMGKLLFLELGPEGGTGRAPVTRTMEDEETQRRANEAMGGDS